MTQYRTDVLDTPEMLAYVKNMPVHVPTFGFLACVSRLGGFGTCWQLF